MYSTYKYITSVSMSMRFDSFPTLFGLFVCRKNNMMLWWNVIETKTLKTLWIAMVNGRRLAIFSTPTPISSGWCSFFCGQNSLAILSSYHYVKLVKYGCGGTMNTENDPGPLTFPAGRRWKMNSLLRFSVVFLLEHYISIRNEEWIVGVDSESPPPTNTFNYKKYI